MKTRYRIKLGIIFILCLTGYILISLDSEDYHANWRNVDIHETKQIGEAISLALIEHHKDNNRFPNNLDNLIPKYQDKIRAPKVGKLNWEYHHEHGGVSLVSAGIDRDIEPIMILRINEKDLTTDWFFDSR